jgi:hypothetical protein
MCLKIPIRRFVLNRMKVVLRRRLMHPIHPVLEVARPHQAYNLSQSLCVQLF